MDLLGKVGPPGHGDVWVSGLSPLALFPGCVLLYKQDFTKKLGLCCITCTYCSQTCQRGVTEQLDGSTWDFCSEDCKSKYLLWYCKVRGAGHQKGGMGHQGAWAVALASGYEPISREGAPAGPASEGSSTASLGAKGPAHLRKAGLTVLLTPPRPPGATPVSARGSYWRPSTGVGRSVISATNSVCCASIASRTNPTWIPRAGPRAS